MVVSGNPVVFTVDPSTTAGVCNVTGTNGTTLNYTAAGTCVVDANQAGNTTFAPATQVQRSVTVVLTPQTITFTAPASGTVGTTATLTATGGASGNPVVFSVDPSTVAGVCNVSGTNGSTLNYTAAGTCVVDANQAGNATFAAAPQVQQSVTVGRADAQTITFTATGLGDRGHRRPPLTATGGASGNPVVFTIDASTAAGVCNVSGTNGSTLNYTAAGTCVVDANQAGNATFAAAPQVQGSVTVVAAHASDDHVHRAAPSGTVGTSAPLTATGGASGNPVVFTVDRRPRPACAPRRAPTARR